MSSVVHINGWPGCGKLTIARLLAPMLEAQLLDNHTLINPAESLFDRKDPLYWPLRHAVRDTVLDYAARLPALKRLIFTDALSDERQDLAFYGAYPALAFKRGLPLIQVLLTIDPAENARRVVSPGRQESLKVSTAEVLAMLCDRHRLLRMEGQIELDVTALSAQQAATQLAQAILAAEKSG